ncbi:ly6/PLAUR domain-containing protein 8-like [Discoglossus pictus]
MKPFLTVLILTAWVATGYSLSCIQCSSTETSTCTGLPRTCPTEYACVSSITRTGDGTIFNRGCDNIELCGKSGSGSIPETKLKFSYTCCNTDNCTPPIPTLPADNTMKNGVTCLGCRTFESDSCNGTAVDCTGDENQCIKYINRSTREPTAPSLILQGCASKGLCEIAEVTKAEDFITEVTCSSGSYSLQHNLIIMFIGAFLSCVKIIC